MSFRRDDAVHALEGQIEVSTAKAVLVNWTLGGQSWVPKSQIKSQSDPDGDGNIIFQITDWFAKKEGLL